MLDISQRGNSIKSKQAFQLQKTENKYFSDKDQIINNWFCWS